MGEEDRRFFQEGSCDVVSMTMKKILSDPGQNSPVPGSLLHFCLCEFYLLVLLILEIETKIKRLSPLKITC